MKNKIRIIVIAVFIISGVDVGRSISIDSTSIDASNVDSTSMVKPKKSKVKKGWIIGPLPAIGFDVNLGFQIGVMAEVFNYGDGSYFPGYKDKFSAEVSYYTKESLVARLFYDSKYLIPNIRFTADVTYLREQMFDFYGFNGYTSPVNYDINSIFYKYHRGQFRSTFDFSGNIIGNLGWIGGVGYYNFDISKIRDDEFKDEITLYDLYIESGLIDKDQANGGNQIVLKVGLEYDSRDHEADPTKGIWAEAVLFGSPDVIDQRGDSYLKLGVAFRHYVPLYKNKITFAYRLAYQGVVAGNEPFYSMQNLNTQFFRQTLSEGLGGMTTVRGVLRNRIVGDGIVWANFEVRYRIFDFRLFKQDWYFAINPFFDAGMVVQGYKVDDQKQIDNPLIYGGDTESVHMSGGIGAQVVMNRNFIISAEIGKAFDNRDSDGIGFRLGVNYLF